MSIASCVSRLSAALDVPDIHSPRGRWGTSSNKHHTSSRLTVREATVVLTLAAAVTLGGCATVRSGEYASVVDLHGQITKAHTTSSGLAITGGELTNMSSRYFGMLLFTFQNPTGRWVHINDMRVGFGNPVLDNTVTMPSGEEIDTWADATTARNVVRAENTATAFELLSLGGALTSSFAHDKHARAAGRAVEASADLAVTITAVNAERGAEKAAQAFSSGHLLALPIAVPPGLFTKRWVVFNTPQDQKACVRGVMLDYDLDDGRRERVWLDLHDSHAGSHWQPEACRTTRRGARAYN